MEKLLHLGHDWLKIIFTCNFYKFGDIDCRLIHEVVDFPDFLKVEEDYSVFVNLFSISPFSSMMVNDIIVIVDLFDCS